MRHSASPDPADRPPPAAGPRLLVGLRRRSLPDATRFLPLLALVSASLWLFAPIDLMRTLVPWAGAAALLCAALFLARVWLRVQRFYRLRSERLGGDRHPAVRRLRRALRQMLTVLAGTLLLSVGFFLLSAAALHQTRSIDVPRLLWSLPIGGLVLSLFFGELVTRLVEAVDDALDSDPAAAGPPDPAARPTNARLTGVSQPAPSRPRGTRPDTARRPCARRRRAVPRAGSCPRASSAGP
jgi:hypothetical protein